MIGSHSEARHVILPLPIDKDWFHDLRTAMRDLYDPVHMRRIVYGVLESIRQQEVDMEALQIDVFPEIETALHCHARRLGLHLTTEESWVEIQSEVTELFFNWCGKMRDYYAPVYPALNITEDEHYGIYAGENDSFFIWVSGDRYYRTDYRDRSG